MKKFARRNTMTRENYNHGGKYKCLLWWRIGSRTQIRRRKKHLMFDCAYNLIICCMSLCTNFPVYSNCPAKCHILWYVLLLVVRMTLYNLHYRLCHISVIPQTIQSTHIRLSVGQWDTTNSVRQNDTQRKKRQFTYFWHPIFPLGITLSYLNQWQIVWIIT